MAHAAADIVIRQDAGARPASSNMLTKASRPMRGTGSAAAAAYPKERLLRRDFRLAKLDMTIWFSSEALADLCERTLVRRKHDDPSAASIEVYAIDAGSGGWEPPALWREDAGFASREFDRILAADNLRGFYHHDAPSWQFYDRATGHRRVDASWSAGHSAVGIRLAIPPVPALGLCGGRHASYPCRHARAWRIRCLDRRRERFRKVQHRACRSLERPRQCR